MTKIKTIDEVSAFHFDKKVNDCIAEGYELTNISMLPLGDRVHYVASLVIMQEEDDRIEEDN